MREKHPPTTATATLVEKIKHWGKELGFSAVGIVRADVSEASPRLARWLELGRHGEMDYMAKHRELRATPAALLPGTVSVITVRLPYWPRAVESERALADDGAAYVSRYALGGDYHRILRRRMTQLARRIETELAETLPGLPFIHRAFSDSAPVMEVEFAVRAGLAWR
ncbi:MAG: DUF1730 domain-containing protein, partial [Candidatus Accumulibacter sp.]|nr:DUF1730 domain-containing protein [Accumulibacter sp.]